MNKIVTAIVVTYNRLDKLKECIFALQQQSDYLEKIVVINNASSDGTAEFLDHLLNSLDNYILEIYNLDVNIGGSGGFSRGIEYAIKNGSKYFWLMDDDTIPTIDALANLLVSYEESANRYKSPVGFVSSKVIWTDGMTHLMNIPAIAYKLHGETTESCLPDTNLIKSCSFVSVLISREAIYDVGLPYEEYFIWGDDIEYTERIVNAGYIGIYNQMSIVIHKTSENYQTDISKDTLSNVWKYIYAVRNRVHRLKIRYKVLWVFYYFAYTILVYMRILKRRDSRWHFLKAVTKGLILGFSFHPSVRIIDK